MKKDDRPPNTTPPPDVQAWLDNLSAQDRQELLRTWQWAALGRDEAPEIQATQTAWHRLQATIASPREARPTADRPAHTPRRLPLAAKTALWLVLFLAGATVVFYLWPSPANREQIAVTPAPQPHFMLLLHDEGLALSSPEEQEAAVAEYVAWADELAAAGHLVAGDELAPEGNLLAGANDPIVRPISEVSDPIGGYFIITAANYEEALSLAKGCPQLRYGGTVEVRPIIQR